MAEWFAHTFPNVVYLGWTGETGWWTAIVQTLYMTFISALIGGLLGLIFGIGVVVTAEDGITPNRPLRKASASALGSPAADRGRARAVRPAAGA